MYKKGVENQAADALSRKRPEEAQINAITHVIPQWISDVQGSYIQDPVAQELIASKLIDPTSKHDYSYINGILRYHGRLYIGAETGIKQMILKHIHDPSIGGHLGMHGSYKRAKSAFYWKGMEIEVFEFVQSCDVYKMNKHDHGKSAGLLQPLPVPEQAWAHITMDFVEGLPKSEGKDAIMVIVDRI